MKILIIINKTLIIHDNHFLSLKLFFKAIHQLHRILDHRLFEC